MDAEARCAANRKAAPSVVGSGIGWVCSRAQTFSCAEVPAECSEMYRTADWVFSRFYGELGQEADPLTSCDFGGAGQYASFELYSGWTGAASCILDAKQGHFEFTTTASTAPGSTTRGTSPEEGPDGAASNTTGWMAFASRSRRAAVPWPSGGRSSKDDLPEGWRTPDALTIKGNSLKKINELPL